MKNFALGRKPVRILAYSILTFMATAWLTLLVNIVLFILLLMRYYENRTDYIEGGAVREELEWTGHGYELNGGMQRKLDALGQWAMLLDETGKVVWSHAKPEEIRDSYTMSDVARMSKWYLEGYPVYLRVWEDEIMVTGIPKNSVWKYNMEFPMSWMDYVKRVWYWILLFDFLWILILAAVFTRRWGRSREAARIEWIAGISHDIRTPLAVVLGYADALEGSPHLRQEERQQAAVIRHQSLVMKELIEDLNLTSRLEYSMQALRKEPLHPAAILREAAAAFLDDAGEETLEVEMDIDRQAEGVVLAADRRLMIRAFRNLFSNSLRHSEQGKTVIRIRLQKERRLCRILFSDNGVGYSEEMLLKLNDRKRKQPSQNIRGLGIVCKIVRAHGGKIFFGNGAEGGSFCEMKFRT